MTNENYTLMLKQKEDLEINRRIILGTREFFDDRKVVMAIALIDEIQDLIANIDPKKDDIALLKALQTTAAAFNLKFKELADLSEEI